MTGRLARIAGAGAAIGAGVAAQGCHGAQSMMAPAGPAAHRIATLGWLVLITFLIVTAMMWVLIFWAAARRRGTLTVHLPWDAEEDRRWIIVGGFAIPAVILAVIFFAMLRTMSAFPMGDEAGSTQADIRVTGHQWWWEVQYLDGDAQNEVLTANELHIPAGRRVEIELRSHDVIHSFWVPRLHGKVDLVPGYINRIRIQADAPGTFEGQCGEYCGPQHAHMRLVVKAETAAAHDAWLQRLRAPAAEPASDAARQGEAVFMNHQCILCHTIRGTPAHGRVGPDLTHLAGRMGIAANTYPNTNATLAAWVTHAQSLKPYAQMPNITAFDGRQLQALVVYLQTLK